MNLKLRLVVTVALGCLLLTPWTSFSVSLPTSHDAEASSFMILEPFVSNRDDYITERSHSRTKPFTVTPEQAKTEAMYKSYIPDAISYFGDAYAEPLGTFVSEIVGRLYHGPTESAGTYTVTISDVAQMRVDRLRTKNTCASRHPCHVSP